MFLDASVCGSYTLEVACKLLLTCLAGGVIGLEREKHGRPAGLRTHLLVAIGACTMMIVSEAFFLKYNALGAESAVRLDPSRTAAQIVTGIGFLGAGVIIKEGANVRGLTTAASLWAVAGLGMAFGMGLVGPGIMSTILVLVSLLVLKKLDPLLRKDRYLTLHVLADYQPDWLDGFDKVLAERKLNVSDFSSCLDLKQQEIVVDVVLTGHRRRIGRELSEAVSRLPGVRRIRYR